MNSYVATTLQAIESAPRFVQSLTAHNVVDILIVSVLFYLILIFIKQTRSFFVLNSLIALAILNYTSQTFNFELTRLILQPLLAGIALITVIVFQGEIRRFFRWVVAGKGFSFAIPAPATDESMRIIAETVFEMAREKIGALIVFPGEGSVDDVVEGGFILDGRISRPLLLSIFDSNSPGHDGAILIQGNRIRKFGLHLPLAEDFSAGGGSASGGKSRIVVGTRHRAAAGISEKTDAIALVVSEERGTVSIAEQGSLRSIEDKDGLLDILKEFSEEVSEAEPTRHSFLYYLTFKNIGTKLLSLGLAIAFWALAIYQTGTSSREILVPIEFRSVPPTLMIAKSSQAETRLILTGRNNDLSQLDLGSVEVEVDLSEAIEGSNEVKLSERNVSLPSYIGFSSIDPDEIEIILEPIVKVE